MAIVLSGTTNDILVNGVSVATDAEVSSAVASGVAPKANTADLKEIGVGQTWQDVTASRIIGTTYTNTTGKPIMAVANGISTGAGGHTIYFTVNGVALPIISGSLGSSGNGYQITSIIPNGATYSLTNNIPLNKWVELR